MAFKKIFLLRGNIFFGLKLIANSKSTYLNIVYKIVSIHS